MPHQILYPLMYSFLATGATIVVWFAMLKRKQDEGLPMRYGILRTLIILDLMFYSLTAFIAVVYS